MSELVLSLWGYVSIQHYLDILIQYTKKSAADRISTNKNAAQMTCTQILFEC